MMPAAVGIKHRPWHSLTVQQACPGILSPRKCTALLTCVICNFRARLLIQWHSKVMRDLAKQDLVKDDGCRDNRQAKRAGRESA